jgi:hypothetical protein
MPPTCRGLVAEGSLDRGALTTRRVEQFKPYREVKEGQDEARTAAAKLLEGSFTRKRLCYIYINNRLDGCPPLTAKAINEAREHANQRL